MVRIVSLVGIGLAAVLALACPPVEAASFDCAQARAPDEETVCRNPVLSALDSEMGGLWYAYPRLPMLMGSNSARRDDAQNFLDRPRGCGRSVGCITSAYRARIITLKRGIDSAMETYADLVQAPNP